MRRSSFVAASLVVFGLCATDARASSVTLFETVFNTDYVSSAIGLSGLGGGPITVTGINGPITQAVLFWRGPKSTGDPNVNVFITIDGTPVTGTDLGDSDGSSSGGSSSSGGGSGAIGGGAPAGQAYGANVTGLVTGNGTYNLGGLLSAGAGSGGGAGTDGGARLFVFFNDGNGSNNQDVVLNYGSVFDPPAWGGPGGLTSLGDDRTDGGSNGSSAFTTNAVEPIANPEPATLLLIGSGLALARRARRSI